MSFDATDFKQNRDVKAEMELSAHYARRLTLSRRVAPAPLLDRFGL